MTYNPFGGLGSIVVTPSHPIVTSRRLGSTGWRLHDTPNGRAFKRTRNGKVKSNRNKVERVLPTLDEATALALVAKLATAETAPHLNLNIHDK